jgi:SAM-dependent methyltransferase
MAPRLAADADVRHRRSEASMGMNAIRTILRHPLTANLDLDDPATTARRRTIVRSKAFLNAIYREWYALIAAQLPAGTEPVLELGSGGGFLSECVSRIVTSDVLPVPGIDLVCDAGRLPLRGESLRGIVMTNVFHHLPDVRAFLADAGRAVRRGGVIVMLEPWNTAWSRFVYRRLHHEPFDPAAPDWRIGAGGPLSAANGALPWILFSRDRAEFEREFPTWRLTSISVTMPFRYLLSGGVSLRSLAPAWTFGLWRGVERALDPWMDRLGLFAQIVLTRVAAPSSS